MVTGTKYVTIPIYEEDGQCQEYPVQVRYEYEGGFVENNMWHQGDSRMEIVQWMKHDPSKLSQETRLIVLKELSNMWDEIVGDDAERERDDDYPITGFSSFDDHWDRDDID